MSIRQQLKAQESVYLMQVYQCLGDLGSAAFGLLFLLWEAVRLPRSSHNCYSDGWLAFSYAPFCAVAGLSLASTIFQTAACVDRTHAIEKPVDHRARDNDRRARRTFLSAYSLGLFLGFVLTMPGRGRKYGRPEVVPIHEGRWDFAESYACTRVLGMARNHFNVSEDGGRLIAVDWEVMEAKEWAPMGPCFPDLVHGRSLAFVVFFVLANAGLLFSSLKLLATFIRAQRKQIPSQSRVNGGGAGPVGAGTLTAVVLVEAGLQLLQLATTIANQVVWHFWALSGWGPWHDLLLVAVVAGQLSASALAPLFLSAKFRSAFLKRWKPNT